VFEGFGTNTFYNGLNTLTGDDFGLVDPFYGHAPGITGGTQYEEVPDFMWQHATGGTPWHVLFGKDGSRILTEMSWDVSSTLADEVAAALAE
jgi:hypothetical protein